MAGRRVTKSAVDWTNLVKKIPGKQKETFRVFKANTDKYVFRMSELPEELPKIDFAEYGKRITNTAMLQEFEKMYSSLKVPYPADVSNVKGTVSAEEKSELQRMNTTVAELNIKLKSITDVLDAIDSVPPPEKMTRQMMHYYFPNTARNPNFDNPGFAPHQRADAQVDVMMKGDEQFFNNRNMRRNIIMPEEFEIDEEAKYAKLIEKEKQAALQGDSQGQVTDKK